MPQHWVLKTLMNGNKTRSFYNIITTPDTIAYDAVYLG